MQEVTRLAAFLVGMVFGALGVYWFKAIQEICAIQDDYESWRRGVVGEFANERIRYRDSA